MVVMEEEKYTKDYLETLSTVDLWNLADEYVALFGHRSAREEKNIDRAILINEILSAVGDLNDNGDEEDEGGFLEEHFDDAYLPTPYNSTEVELVMLNSACAFVYWNISTLDKRALNSAAISELKIRVNCFSSAIPEGDNGKVLSNSPITKRSDEHFDFSISKNDSSHYFLLPAGLKYLRADLLFFLDGIVDILASSPVVKVIEVTKLATPEKIWEEQSFSPIMRLSGIEKVLKNYYNSHTVNLIS